MSAATNVIRSNRDRAAGIVKTVQSMKGDLSLCDEHSGQEFVRSVFNTVILNAGPLQLWMDNYLAARSETYVEALTRGAVTVADVNCRPPVNWEVTHDWCVIHSRGYLMDCRSAIETMTELQNAPSKLSESAWERIAKHFNDEPFTIIAAIVRELRGRSENWLATQDPGDLLVSIGREAAAAIVLAEASVPTGEPLELLHDEMMQQKRKPTREDIAKAFFNSRSPEERNRLLNDYGSKDAVTQKFVKAIDYLRKKRKDSGI